MGFLSSFKSVANRFLRVANVRIDTLTAERTEIDRLRRLQKQSHFDKPIFPILPQFANCDPSPVLQQIETDQAAFAALLQDSSPDGFQLGNSYFSTPDAETLYSIARLYQPRKVIEIGSGNSTQLFRCAIRDAHLKTRLISIDPEPRKDVTEWADEVIRKRAEQLDNAQMLDDLEPNDILFIDSSHKVEIGNDVLNLLLDLLPSLRPGVLVHLHDIFLPFEYPVEWVVTNRWNWNEQYLVQALLQGSHEFEVIWPGHYLQRTMSDFTSHFPNWNARSRAGSLWLRKAQP
jgi:predicted O-methyltransferase YrrM